MKIYTSYYGIARRLQRRGLLLINVALWKPRYICVETSLMEVAPTKWMVKEATDEEFVPAYERILQGLDPRALLVKIQRISRGKDVALCCYEKPGEFCHRHLLAKYITEGTGVRIEEYSLENSFP